MVFAVYDNEGTTRDASHLHAKHLLLNTQDLQLITTEAIAVGR